MEKIDNPFIVFPEEIWEIILDKCENSEDIALVLEALPQLQLLVRGKHFSWLIDSILPLIFPKLITFQDAKNGRLVSKRWKNAVDKSLETHPDHVPYSTAPLDRPSQTHFNYRRLPNITTNIFPFLWFDFDEHSENETWAVSKTNTIQQSSKQAHVSFPGRSVCVTLNHVYAKMQVDNKYWIYSKKCRSIPFRVMFGENPRWQILSTLKSVGHHIYYVNFKLPAIFYWKQELPITELLQCLVLCLSYLPNLKSLKLEAFNLINDDMCEEVSRNIIVALRDASIPARLETLDLWNFGGNAISTELFNSFLSIFVSHTRLKKLTMYAGHWTKELPNMFRNLTELGLDCNPPSSPSKEFSLENTLRGLMRFSCLRKLCVRSNVMNVIEIIKKISVIHIESLELVGETYVESPTKESSLQMSIVSKISKMLWTTQDAVGSVCGCAAPSVRSLKINAMSHLTFSFLSMLPSLQFFTFTAGADDADRFPPLVGGNTSDIVGQCIFKIIRGGSNANNLGCLRRLWETYPSLEMVTVETNNGMYQCVREDPTYIYAYCC